MLLFVDTVDFVVGQVTHDTIAQSSAQHTGSHASAAVLCRESIGRQTTQASVARRRCGDGKKKQAEKPKTLPCDDVNNEGGTSDYGAAG